MLLEHERYYNLGMDALVTVWFGNTNYFIMVCALLLEHERYCGLGMDALVTVCS